MEKNDLIEGLQEQLERYKDYMSQLLIAIFSHGQDGSLSDPHSHEYPISDIVECANEGVFYGIPIVFILNSSRVLPNSEQPRSMKLRRYNLALMSCAEGQESCGRAYADAFADQIANGEREVGLIHDNAATSLEKRNNPEIRKMDPEKRDLLKRNELSLPLKNSGQLIDINKLPGSKVDLAFSVSVLSPLLPLYY